MGVCVCECDTCVSRYYVLQTPLVSVMKAPPDLVPWTRVFLRGRKASRVEHQALGVHHHVRASQQLGCELAIGLTQVKL